MLRRVAIAARPLTRQALLRPQLLQIRHASADLSGAPEVKLSPNMRYEPVPAEMEDDPRMNGNYPDLPPLKRSLRDPYETYWDQQERRNFGEPVHEDNDIMGVFSTYVYDHFTVNWSWVLFGTFVTTFVGFCGVVGFFYPDKPSTKRRFEGGLDKELGGPGSLPALKIGEES